MEAEEPAEKTAAVRVVLQEKRLELAAIKEDPLAARALPGFRPRRSLRDQAAERVQHGGPSVSLSVQTSDHRRRPTAGSWESNIVNEADLGRCSATVKAQ